MTLFFTPISGSASANGAGNPDDVFSGIGYSVKTKPLPRRFGEGNPKEQIMLH